MNCEKIKIYIEYYLDGTLTPLEAGIVEEHIASCPECKKELEELSFLRRELSHLNDDVHAPEGLMDRAMARIRTEKKRKNRKPLYWAAGSIAAVLCVVLALPMLLRGGNSAAKPESPAAPVPAPEMYSYSNTVIEDAAATKGMGYAADEIVMMTEEAGAPMEEPAAEPDAGMSDNAADGELHGLKIIRTAYINLESENYDTDMEALRALVEEFGGFITSTEESGSRAFNETHDYGSRWCCLTVRVPGETLDAFVEAAKAVGIVTSSGINETDVTANYYDTDRQLASYQAQYEKVQGFMERAQSVSELMEIESELSRLQRQIESLQGDLNSWDSRVNFSTVTICIDEVKIATPGGEMTLGARMRLSLKHGWSNFRDGVQDLVVNLYGSIPFIAAWLVGLGLLGIAVLLIVRRVRRKRSGKMKNSY